MPARRDAGRRIDRIVLPAPVRRRDRRSDRAAAARRHPRRRHRDAVDAVALSAAARRLERDARQHPARTGGASRPAARTVRVAAARHRAPLVDCAAGMARSCDALERAWRRHAVDRASTLARTDGLARRRRTQARAVILAAPAHAAARAARADRRRSGGAVRARCPTSPPRASRSPGRAPAIAHPLAGTGFVVARRHSDVRITACTWVSSKWEDARAGRHGAAARVHRRRARSRRRRRSTTRRSSPSCARDLERVLGITAAPVADARLPLAARRRAAHRRPPRARRRRSSAASPVTADSSSPAAASDRWAFRTASPTRAASPRAAAYVRAAPTHAAATGRLAAGREIRRIRRRRSRLTSCPPERTSARSSRMQMLCDLRDVVCVASLCGRVAAQQAPDLNKILADIRAKDKGQLAVSEEDGRFLRLLIASTGRKRALEIGGASGYSAIWMAQGLRATGGKLVSIEYDPVRAKELADNIKQRRPHRRRPGRRRRRVRRDPEAPGHVRLRLPRRVEARLQEVPRRDLSAAGQGRAVHGAQRGEQAERDGGLPRRDPAESFSLDGHRVAVRRRNLAVV